MERDNWGEKTWCRHFDYASMPANLEAAAAFMDAHPTAVLHSAVTAESDAGADQLVVVFVDSSPDPVGPSA